MKLMKYVKKTLLYASILFFSLVCTSLVISKTTFATQKDLVTLHSIEMDVNDNIMLQTVDDYKQVKLTYISKNKKVATIDKNGLIQAVEAGSTKISISYKNGGTVIDDKLSVTVTDKLNVIPTVYLCIGSKDTIKIFDGVSADNAIYKSEDKKVATVSFKGVITANKEGSTVITVTNKKNQKTGTTVVSVLDKKTYMRSNQ